MRLWLHGATRLDDRAMVKGLLAAERILAARGLTLSECLQLLTDATDANQEHHLQFQEAERAALAAAFGSKPPAGVKLGLVLSPGEQLPLSTNRLKGSTRNPRKSP